MSFRVKVSDDKQPAQFPLKTVMDSKWPGVFRCTTNPDFIVIQDDYGVVGFNGNMILAAETLRGSSKAIMTQLPAGTRITIEVTE